MAKKVIKKRKGPVRTCVGCGQARAKKELLRIVRTPQHKVIIDKSGKMNGRGTYVCFNQSCISAAVKGGKIDYALGVSLDREQLEQLQSDIELAIKATTGIS